MTATNDSVLFGVKQIDMINTGADGAADASAISYSIDNPQDLSIAAVYENGERHVLRGGDDILAVIEEDDKLIGFDIDFTLAELVPEIDGVICGGVATGEDGKWSSPASSDEDPYPFDMTAWIQKYTESDSASTTDGYMKFAFPFCKGRRGSQTHANKSFGAPSYTVRARKNESTSEPAITYESAEAIS